jgi:hypothetical protein
MVAEAFAVRLSIELVIRSTCRPALPVGKFVRVTALRALKVSVRSGKLYRRRFEADAVARSPGRDLGLPYRPQTVTLRTQIKIGHADCARPYVRGEIGETDDYAGKSKPSKDTSQLLHQAGAGRKCPLTTLVAEASQPRPFSHGEKAHNERQQWIETRRSQIKS